MRSLRMLRSPGDQLILNKVKNLDESVPTISFTLI